MSLKHALSLLSVKASRKWYLLNLFYFICIYINLQPHFKLTVANQLVYLPIYMFLTSKFYFKEGQLNFILNSNSMCLGRFLHSSSCFSITDFIFVSFSFFSKIDINMCVCVCVFLMGVCVSIGSVCVSMRERDRDRDRERDRQTERDRARARERRLNF